jgi:hypothetical protein
MLLKIFSSAIHAFLGLFLNAFGSRPQLAIGRRFRHFWQGLHELIFCPVQIPQVINI